MNRSRRHVRLMRVMAVSVALAGLGIEAQAEGDPTKPFIGMWRLVSIVDMQGEPVTAWGPHPTGYIVYDAGGLVAVQIMRDMPRQRYAGAQPTLEEAREALRRYVAYFGRYTVDERARTVTHHVEGSTNAGMIGADNVRGYAFGPGDRITLTVMPVTERSSRLTWERVK